MSLEIGGRNTDRDDIDSTPDALTMVIMSLFVLDQLAGNFIDGGTHDKTLRFTILQWLVNISSAITAASGQHNPSSVIDEIHTCLESQPERGERDRWLCRFG